jgi:hypothetical protein
MSVSQYAPSIPKNKDIWINPNDYSLFDAIEITSSTILTVDDYAYIFVSQPSVTITMPGSPDDGIVRIIKNASSGIITISGDIDDLSSLTLYSQESIMMVSFNGIWNT